MSKTSDSHRIVHIYDKDNEATRSKRVSSKNISAIRQIADKYKEEVLRIRRKSTIDFATIRYVADKSKDEASKIVSCFEKIFGKAKNSLQILNYYDKISHMNEVRQAFTSKLIQSPTKSIPEKRSKTAASNIPSNRKLMMEECLTVDINGVQFIKPKKLIAAQKEHEEVWKLNSPYTSLESMKKRKYDPTVYEMGKEKKNIPQLISDVENTHNSIKSSKGVLKGIKETLTGMTTGMSKFKKCFNTGNNADVQNVIDEVNKLEVSTNLQSTKRAAHTPRQNNIDQERASSKLNIDTKNYSTPRQRKKKQYSSSKTAPHKFLALFRPERKNSTHINTIDYFIDPSKYCETEVRDRKVVIPKTRIKMQSMEASPAKTITSLRLLDSMTKDIRNSNEMMISEFCGPFGYAK